MFTDLHNEWIKIYMDNFTVYWNTFEEVIRKLEKVPFLWKETNLALNYEKIQMLLTRGIVLAHHVSCEEIKMDPSKIKVICKLPTLISKKYVYRFLGYAGTTVGL